MSRIILPLVPAKAGTQGFNKLPNAWPLDSRLRGNERIEWDAR
jgi:hypothetical protein